VDELHVVEVILRFASAITLSVAGLLTWGLLSRHALRPQLVWVYLAVVVSLIACWRWVVVLLIPPSNLPPETIEALTPWVQPINQALYTLAGVAVIILVVVSGRQRREL
jgi:hypothetical protein